MKKRLLLRIASIVGVAAMLFTLTACPPKDPCKNVQEPKDTRSFDEQVRAYLEHYQETQESTIIKDQYAAYFDFSDGMECAYTKGGYREVLYQITAAVFSEKCDIYGLESGKIVSMQDWNDNAVFSHICQEKYEKIEAPIEEALKQIVDNKKPSLLVTDFEEYTLNDNLQAMRVSPNNYAEQYFKEWLKMGGVIKFFPADYKEKGLDKKLFFVVFDNNDQRFIDHIEHALKTTNRELKPTYTLQAVPYKVFTSYDTGKGGNFVDSDNDDPLDFKFAVFDDLNAETYYNHEMYSWVQIAEMMMPYRKDPKFTGLLSKLYVDLSETQSCNIKSLKLKVTDITDDFNSFTKNQFALTVVPAPDKSEENVDLTCEQKFFYDGDELKPEYQYSEKDSKINDITGEEFLKINQVAFEESRRTNPKETEVVIDFGDNYSDTSLFTEEKSDVYYLKDRDNKSEKVNGRILKVDVCIDQKEVKTTHQELEEFFNFNSWQVKGGKKTNEIYHNKSITNSVDNTLYYFENTENTKKDAPTVIYTYILKDYPDAYVSIKK